MMITKLIEDGKRKAHQYWPDDTDGEEFLGHVYELGGGIRVEHLSYSFQVAVGVTVVVFVVAVIVAAVVVVFVVVENYLCLYVSPLLLVPGLLLLQAVLPPTGGRDST